MSNLFYNIIEGGSIPGFRYVGMYPSAFSLTRGGGACIMSAENIEN
ncbi:hypothetical protein HMPREF9555_02099 [Selenomonas artemidis F0399]|uniref:Uncharacterized protein n=1 Tax=Selenomonas artemidis F0399 TaxID=749551 RepID=E7N504_9FIRM|nr:hypothetical protein HMPREF9555_02099 [Selenomonas artemidis F0399]